MELAELTEKCSICWCTLRAGNVHTRVCLRLSGSGKRLHYNSENSAKNYAQRAHTHSQLATLMFASYDLAVGK